MIVFDELPVNPAEAGAAKLQELLVRRKVYPAHWFAVQLAPETVTFSPELLDAAVPVKNTVGSFTSHAFVPSAPPQGLNGKTPRKLFSVSCALLPQYPLMLLS